MAAIPYQDDFPSLKEYFGGNGGNFAKFGESWNDAVTDADFWEDSSAESRQNLMNFFLADYNNRFNVYQNELAYQRQKEMINAENEYNSPRNQMARYIEGGLNPNVIYGQIQPGQQTQVAQYDPARATDVKAVGDPRGTKEQKFAYAMQTLEMVSGFADKILGMLSGAEAVKSQSLKNELLEAQLPMLKRFEEWKEGWWFNPDMGTPDQMDPHQRSIFDLVFPRFSASDLARYRSDFQQYYNDNLLPKLERIQRANVTKAEAQAGILEYNEEMLNSFHPAVRPWAALILQIVQALTRAYPSTK